MAPGPDRVGLDERLGEKIPLGLTFRDEAGQPVTLRLTDEMPGPCVCGFARPVILLPTVLPPGLGPDGLRTILTHELAHIKRRDPWVSLAQTVLRTVVEVINFAEVLHADADIGAWRGGGCRDGGGGFR